MKKYQNFSFLMAFFMLFSQCGTAVQHGMNKLQKPLKIIFMIGDGMGLAQICSASVVNGGLFIELMTEIGFIKTSSADDYITDSAAGATAFSTGEKTFNGAIGVGVDSLKRKTILEWAEEHGYYTGLISTCSVTHATPASFFAHQISRKMNFEIANDIYGKGIDFVAGTGKPYFNLDKLKTDGYQIYTGIENPKNFINTKLFWFFNDSIHPPTAKYRNNWLANSTLFGINFLNKSNIGFFMMVEGSQIDWGGHDNNADYVIDELIDFDKAVKQALDFAKKDGRTLVIVTADHETGGMALNHGNLENKTIDAKFTTKEHTGIMVPVFSYGPGSNLFKGVMENTDIYHKIKLLLEK